MFYRLACALLFAAALYSQTVITGTEVPELTAFDQAIPPLLEKWKVPGAALAISDGGRLIYARGFGYADSENKIPVQPFSLFRIASISKTVTAVTIMKLVEEGKLNLDAKLGTILPDLTPLPGRTVDPRVKDITIRQLLHHLGGWDRTKIPGGDPALIHTQSLKALPSPPTPFDLARYSISSPLSFAPGAGYAYSNTGFTILGRVIEKVTGKKYEDYVRENVLGRMGVSEMRIARTLASQRYADEVRYYDAPGSALIPTIIPGQTGNVPAQYGGLFMIELTDSSGGWVASAIDLLRYLTAIDGRRAPAFLSSASIAEMLAKPPYLANPNATSWYAKGWNYTPTTGGEGIWEHDGALSGTRTNIVRFASGRAYAIVFNSRPADENPIDRSDPFKTEVTQAINAAFSRVQRFPSHDLFPQYARQSLQLSADSLSFHYQLNGDPPPAQRLNVTSDGPLPIYHTLASNVPRIRSDKANGFTAAAYEISLDPAGLAEGEHNSLITISSSDARNSPRTVPVAVRVYGPVLLRNAASLEPGPVAPGSLVVLDPQPAQVQGLKFADLDAGPAGPNRFLVPLEAAPGETALSLLTPSITLKGSVLVQPAAPGIFSAAGDGKGAALATAITIAEDGSESSAPAYLCESGTCSTSPIDLGPETSRTILLLTTTGLRNADISTLAAVIGDEAVQIEGVAPAGEDGKEIVRIVLDRKLAGRGDADAVLIAGETRSNRVRNSIK